MSEARWKSLWPLVRDVLLFIVGLAGVIHEVVMTGVERPTLLMLLGAMVGLPLFFRADERRNGNGNGKGSGTR